MHINVYLDESQRVYGSWINTTWDQKAHMNDCGFQMRECVTIYLLVKGSAELPYPVYLCYFMGLC